MTMSAAIPERYCDPTGSRPLGPCITGDAGAVQLAAPALEVVEGVVHGATVVPDGQGVASPAQPARQVLLGAVAVEVSEQPLGLRRGPTLEADGVHRVEVQGGAAGHGMLDDRRVHPLAVGLLGGFDGHGAEAAGLVEHAPGPVGDASRVHGAEAGQRPAQAGRQRLVGQVLVGPHRVAAVVGDVPGVQQGVGRRLGKVAEVAVPGVAEVELVVGLLDHPDHVGTIGERGDIRGHRPAPQQLGHPLEVVEGQVLVGKEHHQMLGQRPPHPFQLVGLADSRQVDPGDLGAQGASDGLGGEGLHDPMVAPGDERRAESPP